MRATGMTVALATYWLAGVVGAASLPPDDQYSPQQSPYKRDVARGPRGYPNWLEYHQDPSAGLEPPENKPDMTLLRASDLSRESNTRKDPMTRDLDFMSLTPGGWNAERSHRLIKNFTGAAYPNLDVPEEMSSASQEEPFVAEDTFQDQGPGSVEVYKLDLRRENSLLVPQTKRKQPAIGSRIKSKNPKKVKGDEILWKVKPIEPRKSSLPEIFRQPPSVYRDEAVARESNHKIEENRKDEVFAVGGVPELQVGCEGLEASDRKRRSSEPGEEETDEEHWPKFKDPVYRESTEPILLRVTPIILDFEDETPPGRIYEELDELLKLKSSTTSETTTKRRNRGDIDPALENYHHEEPATDESLPERGDLGPYNIKNRSRVERSIRTEDSQDGKAEGVTFPKEANRDESPLTAEIADKDDDTLSPIVGNRFESLNHRGGRKLLWVQYPERRENQARTRHHQGTEEHEENPDLWGFGEDDGDRFDDEDESEANKLRKLEVEKRQREYERRRQEEVERRRRPQSQEHSSRTNEVLSESERIRKEYDRQQENEQRERQRIEEERRRNAERRQWEDGQRRIEDAKRRQSEETRRRLEEEERRNRDPSHARRREEEERRRQWNRRREEEERRLRQENERNNQAPPSSLTRPSTNPRPDNRSRTRQEEERREAEERKLREYIERNNPIDLKKNDDHRRPENRTQWRNQNEDRRRYNEAQRRRQLEEERRRQLEEKERSRQMEEHQRQQELRNEEERKRQMEEERRRNHPSDDRAREEERRRRLEEERKLQEYVKRNQPVHAPRRNSSLQERDWQEQRRTIDAARQWEHNKQHVPRTHDGRSHGPSAPTNIGHRQPQGTPEELRRQQETERLEAERRRFLEEGRRREEEYRRELSRRHEEERRRLEAARRAEETNRHRSNSYDYRRPTNSSHSPAESRNRGPGELRRNESSQSYPNNTRRTLEDQWGRRSDEDKRRRLQQLHEQRERTRIEDAKNDRNNAHRRPQHENTGLNRQRGESVRSQQDAERRRREEARLRSLPVSARIIVRSDETSSQAGNLRNATRRPPFISFGTRGDFRNDIDFPAISPNRPGLQATRFPAPATLRPPSKSPSPCVWAIVNCCPANNRLTTCFESMGCPAGNWDANPCRPAVQSAARAQVLSFFENAEENYTRA